MMEEDQDMFVGRRRKVVICPGFRRCGSTSLQGLLIKNREKLAPYADVSARDDLTKEWRNTVLRLFRQKRTPDLTPLKVAARNLADTIRSEFQSDLIISDENLIGFEPVSGSGLSLFDFAAMVLPILEDGLSEFELEFVFVTRDFDEWLRSSHRRSVERKGDHRGLEEYIAAVPEGQDFETARSLISSALRSPVHFVRLEDDLIGTVPGRTVLNSLDLPAGFIEQLEPSGILNASSDSMTVERTLRRNRLMRLPRSFSSKNKKLIGKVRGRLGRMLEAQKARGRTR